MQRTHTRLLPGLPRSIDADVDRYYRIAAHGATLTRLARRIDTLMARGGRDGQHLRAASTAYDQTLLLAAREFGIEAGRTAPLPPIERLALEAELSVAGLRWSRRHD